jgi:uncharacterized paraquat-inducible protein A
MPKLAPCPDCKRMISLAAATCPQCGRAFKAGDLVPIQPEPLSTRSIIWMIVVSIIILYLVIMGIKGVNELQEDERIKQRIMDTERRRGG